MSQHVLRNNWWFYRNYWNLNTQQSLVKLETKLVQGKQSSDSVSNDNFQGSCKHSLFKKKEWLFYD